MQRPDLRLNTLTVFPDAANVTSREFSRITGTVVVERTVGVFLDSVNVFGLGIINQM
jgi:hypothetical protein